MKLLQCVSQVLPTFMWFIVTSTASTQNCEAPTVKTTSGIFQGFSIAPSVHAYLGMPYAKPPVDDLRFERPQALVSKNSTVRDATRPFSGCYQEVYNTALADKVAGTGESEDCLFINVWKPANATPESGLPVLIWIYGGGFAQGASLPTDGTEFVSEQQGIIMVSFNYRINIFGFPNSPAITHKNVGFLDQRLAIEWARDNIAAFGGDPKRIVLMGQSAGSISVATYAFAYPDNPIVSGLIELSGQPETLTREDGASWTKVAESVGCRNQSSSATELACMKAQPPRRLKRGISLSNLLEYGDLVGGTPVADNITIFAPAEYIQRGLAGRFAKIPLWTSHTLHEGDNLVPFQPHLPAPNAINTSYSDLITLAAFHCPTSLAALYRVHSQTPVYRSVYSGIFPALQPYPWMRAYHAADVYLMFGAAQTLGWEAAGPHVREAASYLRGAVAAFVKDPAAGLREYGWVKYNASGRTLVNLFENNEPKATFLDVEDFDAPCQALSG